MLLMVQKSQGQPPGMFFNPINSGDKPTISTGAGFQSSTVEPVSQKKNTEKFLARFDSLTMVFLLGRCKIFLGLSFG